MPSHLILYQNDYFYVAPWTCEAETEVLMLVEDEFTNAWWIVGDDDNNRSRLVLIIRQLRQYQETYPTLEWMSLPDIWAKLQQWCRRYHIFNMLITHPLVSYTPNSGNPAPRTTRAVWNDLREITPKVL